LNNGLTFYSKKLINLVNSSLVGENSNIVISVKCYRYDEERVLERKLHIY